MLICSLHRCLLSVLCHLETMQDTMLIYTHTHTHTHRHTHRQTNLLGETELAALNPPASSPKCNQTKSTPHTCMHTHTLRDSPQHIHHCINMHETQHTHKVACLHTQLTTTYKHLRRFINRSRQEGRNLPC